MKVLWRGRRESDGDDCWTEQGYVSYSKRANTLLFVPEAQGHSSYTAAVSEALRKYTHALKQRHTLSLSGLFVQHLSGGVKWCCSGQGWYPQPFAPTNTHRLVSTNLHTHSENTVGLAL